MSVSHPIVKRLVRLRKDRAFRYTEKSVVITGKKLVEEVSASIPIRCIISEFPFPCRADQHFTSRREVMEKIIGFATDDLVVAEVNMPPLVQLHKQQTVIVLDQLADPGNVGTILRTALAMGIEGVFLTTNTADPFNDKALRAARGAPLFLPLQCGSLEELQPLLFNRHIYIADVGGKDISNITFHRPLTLILGHETRGSTFKSLGQQVAIPMHNQMESLNVAAAASILISHIQRGNR